MRIFLKVTAAALTFVFAQLALAEMGGQVFYHYGMSSLNKDRGGQVFTDTGAATTRNDDKSGFNIGAGLDLPLVKDMGPGDLMGQIMVDYSRYSQKLVTQATSALLGAPVAKEVTVSSLNVLIAPKYRFAGFMDGKLVPWIIPAGLSFLVNSPPSNNTTYLDLGYHVGAGMEYKVISELSLGLAYRATFSTREIDIDTSYSSFDIYAGINF